MKAKTFIELATMSANLYAISKDPHLLEKLQGLSEQDPDKIKEFIAETGTDEHGNEISFTERVLLKAKEAREELEEKIGEMASAFYEKMNIANAEKLSDLERRLKKLTKNVALAEARIYRLEKKGAENDTV